ncbi:hypothetical protein SAMN05444274_11719 [Mariniphaga anaerophila]|uniref:Uncharacterized protein n=1 Tax=Mariniphaga anaerophila TaxID=1484053 RepID=A0A1M5G6C3_9BACT|nr:DUF6132 family protein [Mariniphaga anaerophila]SHF99011.1 hypothetical protein SAMN05444274_11719 [Mariniphaga anaerophila]
MKAFLKGKSTALAFTAVGALGGFLYWKFVGCTSGTCPIKSVWYWSVLWGAAMGYLVGDSINDFVEKRKKKTEEKK